MLDMAPSKQEASWLSSLSRALEAGDAAAATDLFVEDCYWRDLLTFTWNIKTMKAARRSATCWTPLWRRPGRLPGSSLAKQARTKAR
jgi:hypothetical protein